MKQEPDKVSVWKELSKSCPWQTFSGNCAATKVECKEQLCAFAYWENERKCGCTGITE